MIRCSIPVLIWDIYIAADDSSSEGKSGESITLSMITQNIIMQAFNLTSVLVHYSEIEVGGVIGKGSFAIVNKGKWNGQDVALKRIRVPGGYDSEDITDLKF